MTDGLADQACVLCRRGASPLARDEAERLAARVPAWTVSPDGTRLSRRLTFGTFAEALDLVVRVSALAEAENHHPDIAFGWGYAEMSLTTHAIGGLHLNDFVMAAKIDRLARPERAPR